MVVDPEKHARDGSQFLSEIPDNLFSVASAVVDASVSFLLSVL